MLFKQHRSSCVHGIVAERAAARVVLIRVAYTGLQRRRSGHKPRGRPRVAAAAAAAVTTTKSVTLAECTPSLIEAGVECIPAAASATLLQLDNANETASNFPEQQQHSYRVVLDDEDSLGASESLWSPNRTCELRMEEDGDLALYVKHYDHTHAIVSTMQWSLNSHSESASLKTVPGSQLRFDLSVPALVVLVPGAPGVPEQRVWSVVLPRSFNPDSAGLHIDEACKLIVADRSGSVVVNSLLHDYDNAVGAVTRPLTALIEEGDDEEQEQECTPSLIEAGVSCSPASE